MREVINRCVNEGSATEERQRRIISLLATGLERYLRLQIANSEINCPEAVDFGADVSVTTHDQTRNSPEEH